MLKAESYRKGIVLSILFNIFNKGIVFLNGILIASFFGTNPSTDIYFFVYNAVAILGIFFTSMNSSVIIPESMRIRHQEGNQEAIRFLNFFVFLYGGIAIVGLAITFINPISFFFLVSNFDYNVLHDHNFLLHLSLPLFALICLINLLIDILSSYKFFTISMIVGIINGSISILFILFFNKSIGITAVFYGMLLAYIVNLVLLIVIMKKYVNWRFSIPRIKISKRIWKNIGFAQLGNLTSTLSVYAPIYILSGFSTGIITALTFAQQISSLPVALIITQFSSVAGIKFNELYSRGEHDEVNRIFVNMADFLLFIVIPISGICFIFSNQIINILLDHGKFSAEGLSYASTFLKYLGMLLPFTVINTLFARLFMASHKIKDAFWYQTVLNTILIVAIYFSVHSFGIIGYPASVLSVYFLNAIFCYFLEKRYFNIINYKQILINLGIFLLLNLAICIAIFYVMSRLDIESDLVAVAGGSILYASIVALLSIKFNLNTTLNNFIKEFPKKANLQ